MASNIIELRSVSLSFGRECLLENINLSIAAGEAFVLVGPSGQGKSLLLKIMAGVIVPTSGEVWIEENNLHLLKESTRHLLMRRMGMLFQKNALFDSMTVGENIAFPLREVTGLLEDQINSRVAEFLEAVGLAHARDLYPDEISGGMQKRLGIARALALEPEIIFYDDPTAGLDPITSRRIIELIIKLQRERRSTVVAITNDMGRAFQMADRIAMVVDRGIIVMGDVKATKMHTDPRVHQFIRGEINGPLTAGSH